MNEECRQAKLLEVLDERKVLSTADIISLLDISPATARRDINKLNEQGRLRKVRNGAQSIKVVNHRFTSLLNVANVQFSEKERIAYAAAKLCKDGESVILTCGSTMLSLANKLCRRDLQIITNYLPLANYLIEHNHENVVITGGQYSKSQAIMLSISNSSDSLYAANIMFTSGKGFTEEGLYKADMLIANSEQLMVKKAGKLVILLDSRKLGKQVGMLFSELANIDLLITGKEADSELIQQLKQKGLEIILA